MNRYVIGNSVTGEIARTVTCDSSQVAAQVLAGEVLDLHDSAEPSTHYFLSGALIAYTEDQRVRKALKRPSETWSNASMSPIDNRSLAGVKVEQNEHINLSRLSANRSTFLFSGKLIACDELSRSDIDAVNGVVALTNALPPGFPGGWKAIDNTYVAIPDKAAWISFYVAMVAQGVTNFNHTQTLKAALIAALTIADAEAITW